MNSTVIQKKHLKTDVQVLCGHRVLLHAQPRLAWSSCFFLSPECWGYQHATNTMPNSTEDHNPDVVEHTCHPSTRKAEAEARGLRVQDQTKSHSKFKAILGYRCPILVWDNCLYFVNYILNKH